ncbi:hypothetical protein TNCV_638121 [Trichonephila clavipes]|nr:hypothetical protein TNCV_638121 [Trichonephila clavipes]
MVITGTKAEPAFIRQHKRSKLRPLMSLGLTPQTMPWSPVRCAMTVRQIKRSSLSAESRSHQEPFPLRQYHPLTTATNSHAQ